MRTTTPKKVIPLKPKITPIQQVNQKPNYQYVSAHQVIKPMPTKMFQPFKPIETRVLSPNIQNHSIMQNRVIRPSSMQGTQVTTSPRQSIQKNIDIQSRIPPLKFSHQSHHSPRIVDSVVISRQQARPTTIHFSPQTPIHKSIIINSQSKPQTIQSKILDGIRITNSPKKQITASKMRELPIRYQPPSKQTFQKKISPIKVTEIKHLTPRKQIQLCDETTISSSSKVSSLNRKTQQIVRTNQQLQCTLQQLTQILTQKDSQNKRNKNKASQLTQKFKQIKHKAQKLSDTSSEIKLKLHQQINNIKIQYGSDLFRLQTELKQTKEYKQQTMLIVSNLERQQQQIQAQLFKFKQLFKNLKNGLGNVKF